MVTDQSLLGAVIGIKDERSLVLPNLWHWRRIGAKVLYVDYGSKDGSRRMLARASRLGLCEVQDGNQRSSYEELAREDLERARKLGTQWAFIGDVDEFLIGDVRRGLERMPSERGAVIPRANLLPQRPRPGWLRNPALLRLKVPDARISVERGVPFVCVDAGGKVIISPRHVDAIAIAAHDAVDPLPEHQELMIAHLPFSTWARFRRKVENARRQMEMTPERFTGGLAWQWRYWAQMNEEQLRKEFELQREGKKWMQAGL